MIDCSSSCHWLDWIDPVPHCCVGISRFRHHNIGKYGCNVEGWPLEHRLEKNILSEILISSLSQLFLNWNPPWVMNGVRLISIIVSLNQKPNPFAQLIVCFSWICFSLDDHSLIIFCSWYDEVNRTRNLGFSESFCGFIIVLTLQEGLSDQPKSRNIVLNQNADQCSSKSFGMPGINPNSKVSMSNSCDGKNTSCNSVFCK